MQQETLSLEECLNPTEFCDFYHAEIQAQAKKLLNNAATVQEKIQAIYHFVRDLPYSFQPFAQKASETLLQRTGQCYNKANLEVALLRAVGVPAAYALVGISLPEFKPINGQEEVIHAYAVIWIDGKWKGADATEDPLLAKALGHGVYECTGKYAIEVSARKRKTPIAYYANIDEILKKKEPIPPEIIAASNTKLELLRKDYESRN